MFISIVESQLPLRNDLTIQRKQDADRERVPGAGKGKTSLSLSKSGEGLLVRAVEQRSDEI